MYLTHRWNIPYQYELNRLGNFKYLDLGELSQWDYSVRPLDHPFSFEKLDEIKLSDYEAMIIHFDGHVLADSAFDPFKKLIELPIKKVIVCHGAPPMLGRFSVDTIPEEAKVDSEAKSLVESMVGSCPVVLPNKHAQKMWSFKESVVIEPTLSEHHYPYIKKTMSRALTVSPCPSALPLDTGYRLMVESCTGLDFCDLMGTDFSGFIRSVRTPSIEEHMAGQATLATEDLSRRMFYDQMNLIGSYACYFNTGFRVPWSVPMHEALLLGTAVVTTNHFGEAEFIKNGYDGFIAKDAMEMRNAIIFLSKNFDTSVVVGQRARDRALKRLRGNDFIAKWKKLLKGL